MRGRFAAVRNWLNRHDATAMFIEPWEHIYGESLISKMRDELLNGEILDTLEEAKVFEESWRKAYKRIRPHSSLGHRPLGSEAHMWPDLHNQNRAFHLGSIRRETGIRCISELEL